VLNQLSVVALEDKRMADATGHMDRPGAGPDSVNISIEGLLTGYYSHPNKQTGKVELVKANPPGTPDEVIEEFEDYISLNTWFLEKWREGKVHREPKG
jgi:hypothetical protein